MLAIAAIVTLIASSKNTDRGVMEMVTGSSYGGSGTTIAPGAPAIDDLAHNTSAKASMPAPYPYPGNNDVSANDTREFMKTNYYATLRTRSVQALTRRVETTVRGHQGRVDQTSSSEQNGYVQFVVPMSQFEDFRTEVESMVGPKFISLQVSQQNLLPQKQSIEEQQKQAEATLASYQSARQSVVNTHAATLKSIQANLDQAVAQGASADTIATLQSQIANENAAYAKRLAAADANIKYAKDWQTAVKTQDQTLIDNVATVNGTISLQWISLWDIAHLYVPGEWIPAIIAVLAVVAYLWERRLWVFRTFA